MVGLVGADADASMFCCAKLVDGCVPPGEACNLRTHCV